MCIPTLQVREIPEPTPPCRPIHRPIEETIIIRPGRDAWIRKRGLPGSYTRVRGCEWGIGVGGSWAVVESERSKPGGASEGAHGDQGGTHAHGPRCALPPPICHLPPISQPPPPPPPLPQMPTPIPQPKPSYPPPQAQPPIQLLPPLHRRRSHSSVSVHSFHSMKRRVRVLWERVGRVERKEERLEEEVERGRQRERSRVRLDVIRRIREREEREREEERQREETRVKAAVRNEVEKRERERVVKEEGERKERERLKREERERLEREIAEKERWVREGEWRERERERERDRGGRVVCERRDSWEGRERRGRWEEAERWRPAPRLAPGWGTRC
ncbi:hypothetical protein MMC34_007497 [Xylographa carneopallida]|nr:hypothetical protein [Xylographa carneopallida]